MSKDKSEIYYQRNLLVVLIGVIANQFFNPTYFTAGWGIDGNENWGPQWRTVVYIELPIFKGEGEIEYEQICFHMGPKTKDLAKSVLPRHRKGWDGSWFDTHEERIKSYINRNNQTRQDGT